MGEAPASGVNNTLPVYEYLLQGSVLDSARDALVNRLQGLCDNIETGIETFVDYELAYTMRSGSQTVPPNQTMTVRVRKSLDQPDMPWHIRYLGIDPGDKSKQTLIRSCIEAGTSSNVSQFLTDMGFRLDYEFVVKGCMFRRGRMKVTVSKLYRLLISGNTEQLEPLTASHLVELSVVTVIGQEQVQEDMKLFSDQLKPLVHLDKLDHRRLQQAQGS